MKRCLALLTLLALLLALPVGAAEAEETPWTRTEGDGSYVTIRIPCPEGNDLLSASRILLSGDDSLKLLSIDGIAPNDAAIADGTYPLSGYNYIALRADEPEDSPAHRMVEFMLSEQGQTCVINAGFGALRPTPEEYLSGLKAGDISCISWPVGREVQPSTAEVVSLLNAVAASGMDHAPQAELLAALER